MATDAVPKLVTSLGPRTRKGRVVTKRSWGRLLANPIYAGWVVSGKYRVRGIHEALISDATFQKVQQRVNGKSTPHKALNDDFPLHGLVRCMLREISHRWMGQRSQRELSALLVLEAGLPEGWWRLG